MRTIVLFALIQCAFGQQPIIQSIQNGASSVAGAVASQMLVAIHGSSLAAQPVWQANLLCPLCLAVLP